MKKVKLNPFILGHSLVLFAVILAHVVILLGIYFGTKDQRNFDSRAEHRTKRLNYQITYHPINELK